MHPSGLYIVVSTANRMYFLGILRSELQSIAEFPLVGAGKAQFNVDGGKFAVSTNKQVSGLPWSWLPPPLPFAPHGFPSAPVNQGQSNQGTWDCHMMGT